MVMIIQSEPVHFQVIYIVSEFTVKNKQNLRKYGIMTAYLSKQKQFKTITKCERALELLISL